MEDEAILLKIKRQFEKDESINALLKIISGLRTEIGMLKSEADAKEFKIEALNSEMHKLKYPVMGQEAKTKKEWLRDELIKELSELDQKNQLKNRHTNEEMERLKIKYYALLRQTLENKKDA